MTAARPPAGWYPDPLGAAPQRWWDGQNWTGYLFDPGFAVAATDPATVAVASEPAAAVTAVAERAPVSEGGQPAVAKAPVAPQRVLLGLGAVLLIAAAAAFVAFAWTVVGPSGRAALITLVAAAFLIAAVAVRLTAIRETFAVIGVGTVAVELVYGSASGLIPEGAFDPEKPWLALTLAAFTGACAALARWGRLVSPRIVAGGAFVLGVIATIAYAHSLVSDINPTAFFAGGLTIAAVATFAVPQLAVWPSVRIVAALALAGIAWLIVCLALLILFAEDDLDADWVVALAVIAGAIAALWFRAPAGQGLRPALALVAAGFGSAAVGLAIGLGLESAPTGSAVSASVLGCGAVLLGLQFRRPWLGLTSGLALLALWSMSSGLARQSVDQEQWSIAAFITAAAVLAVAYALLGREPRVVWAAGPLLILAAWLLLDGADVELVEAYALAFVVGVTVTFAIAAWREVVTTAVAIDGTLVGALSATLPSAAVALFALDDERVAASEWLSIAVTATGIVGAFAVAVLRRRLRWLAGVAAAVLLLEVWILGGTWLPGDPTLEFIAWTFYTCFALAALVIVPRTQWRAVLGWGAVIAAATSMVPAALWAWDAQTADLAVIPWLSLTLTAVAVVALIAVGFRTRTAWLFWIAAALAWCVVVGVVVVRWWPHDDRAGFVATGVVLLIAGACTRVVMPTAHSMVWLGIPLLFVVVPFAITPGCDPAANPVGFTVVLTAAGVLAIVGAVRRVAGLLVPGAVGLGIIAANVLWDAALAVPAWVSLGLAGAILLVIGVRLEATRAGARKGTAWLKSLD